MKRTLWSVAIAASLPFVIACTKSIDRAERDVQRAHNEAVQDVREEQRDLQATRRDAAERIAKQERRVEDAARQGNERVIEEKRELEDARREEIRRESNDITPVTPRVDDRAVLPSDRTPRVDVNINRTPSGGVNVDVNRNP